MSQENMGVIRGLYEAFARGDIPAVLGTLDANVKWQGADGSLYADQNPYIGPGAVLGGVFARFGGKWGNSRPGPTVFWARERR